MADSTPTWSYEIEYYINTGSSSSPTWTFVDYDTSFNPARDNTTYDASYKSRKVQPSWVVSSRFTVEFDIDIVEDETLQQWFVTNEDVANAPTDILRVWKTGASPFAAKKAAFNCNCNPLDAEAGGPAHATGTMIMVDDGWTNGTVTFNQGVPTFTATV